MPVVVLMASCWALERRRGRISGKTEDHPGLQQPYPKEPEWPVHGADGLVGTATMLCPRRRTLRTA